MEQLKRKTGRGTQERGTAGAFQTQARVQHQPRHTSVLRRLHIVLQIPFHPNIASAQLSRCTTKPAPKPAPTGWCLLRQFRVQISALLGHRCTWYSHSRGNRRQWSWQMANKIDGGEWQVLINWLSGCMWAQAWDGYLPSSHNWLHLFFYSKEHTAHT